MNHFLSLFFLFVLTFSCKVSEYEGTARPITHEKWTDLLKKHVNESGMVDYTGFQKDSTALQEYLGLLESHHPNEQFWSREEQLAYWMNAYNAFTIELILNNYPLKSIKDIKDGIPFVNSVWDIKFITIEDREYDLNNIEHGILRKYYDEPRIHFGINCASFSCPPLLNNAFTADQVTEQLDFLAKRFINDPDRNQINVDAINISKIFKWFGGDFKKEGDIIDYLNNYSDIKISDNAKVDYLDYNWELNAISD